MIAVISPAKTLDFSKCSKVTHTLPRFTSETNTLIEILRTKTTDEIKSLMSISENLAELNVGRYQAFSKRHTENNSKQCGLAFKGDVYVGLEAQNFDENDLNYAQDHLRILSGLYGLLRPLDLIQAYRLEMGTKLAFDDYHTLYGYWEDKIAKLLNKDLKAQGDDILINLASNEYFKAIDRRSLKARIIDVDFLDLKNDKYKIISFYAKKARGLMSRYIVQNRIKDINDLQGFDYEGYRFDPDGSSENKLIFLRD